MAGLASTCAVIQEWLGHSSPVTTSVYTHLTVKAEQLGTAYREKFGDRRHAYFNNDSVPASHARMGHGYSSGLLPFRPRFPLPSILVPLILAIIGGTFAPKFGRFLPILAPTLESLFEQVHDRR